MLVDDAAKLQSVEAAAGGGLHRADPGPCGPGHRGRRAGRERQRHGSGVLVSQDGLVLTNYHVVGNSERVRVVLDDGTALTGVVERRHKVRDVALVRVEGGHFTALPVRAQPLTVSEEVYAIGAPLQERLRGTVTRGIVSAFRRDRLTGLETIQAECRSRAATAAGRWSMREAIWSG